MPALGETTDALPSGDAPGSADGNKSWRGIAAEAASCGANLTPESVRQLIAYRDLLLEWNTRFNLTSIKEPEAVERVLLLDAIRMLPALDRAIADSGLRHPSLIDIGSGGGLPAIPLAICRPDLDVTMVDATGKKVQFLAMAIETLGLSSARAIHARAEELAREPAERERYDLASARAVASLPALTELVAPFLRVGGVALLPKGLAIDDEIASAGVAFRELGCELAGTRVLEGGEKSLITIRKIAPTPARYPRRSGLPAHQPLGMAGGSRP